MLPQWLLWAMLAVLCWGLWAITSKLIGNALSAGQSQALSTIGLVPIIAILAFTKSKTSEHNRRGIIIGFLSGVLVCLGNIAYYHALNLGGKAATVVSITALYPLITALLAMLLLKERLNEFQIFGIGLSIASMVIFNIYSTEGWASGWLVYAMIPVVLWGVGGLLQKISTNHISGELSTLWFLVAFVPVAFVLLIAEPLKQPIEMRVWMLASALGFFFGLGNLAILLAFAREGKASVIAPLAGLYPVVSIPIAILFLGEKVSGREWLGIGLALTAVVALAWEGKKIEKAEVVPL
jgi:uncharacterized membrane protein